MNFINRGIRNAFRNITRATSIVFILGLSIALALSMLLAHQAVNKKISSVKGRVGNTITLTPAGLRGFSGGGNPLTQTQLAKISNIAHVISIEESLNDRLSGADTTLQSAVDAGSLGRRFGGPYAADGYTSPTQTFSLPITVIGSNDPTDLNSTQGGGTFNLKSGHVFSSTSTDSVALIGASLAAKNNLSVGSTFTAYNTSIKVLGIFDSGNTFSNNLVIMPLSSLQTLSGQTGDVTNAVVSVDSISNVDSVTAGIKNQLGSSADITSSKDQAETAVSSLDNIASISLYSLIGALVAGAVIIFLVMLMIVRERKREIGVLKAVGASNLRVMGQFMVEAVTLTLLAAAVGILISVVTAQPITSTLVSNTATYSTAQTPGFGHARGFGHAALSSGNFVAPGRGFGRFRSGITNINVAVGWEVIAYGLGAAILIALAGSAVASFSISKVRPAEVLRTE